MTKRQAAIKRNQEWAKALIEGRVVRNSENTLTSYKTVEQALAAVATINADPYRECDATIVIVP